MPLTRVDASESKKRKNVMSGEFDENLKPNVSHVLLVQLLLDFSLSGGTRPFRYGGTGPPEIRETPHTENECLYASFINEKSCQWGRVASSLKEEDVSSAVLTEGRCMWWAYPQWHGGNIDDQAINEYVKEVLTIPLIAFSRYKWHRSKSRRGDKNLTNPLLSDTASRVFTSCTLVCRLSPARLEAMWLLTIAVHEAIEQYDCLTDVPSNCHCN